MFWKPTIALECDVGSFLLELSKTADDLEWDPEWITILQKRDKEKEEANRKVLQSNIYVFLYLNWCLNFTILQMAEESTETHLNPLTVLHALEDILPDNAILVADGGDFVGSAAYILRWDHEHFSFFQDIQLT